MNKKLKALWQSFKSKLQGIKQEKSIPVPLKKVDCDAVQIECIANTMNEDDCGTPEFESKAEYGVRGGVLSDVAIRLGGHVIQTGQYRKSDGFIIKYPNKIKRNDGSIETISILTKEEAEKLAQQEELEREAKIGFPPRCPECKVVLPEGTILGPSSDYQKPYEDCGNPLIIGINSKPCLAADDRSDDPLAKVVTEVVKKKGKSRPRRKK